MELCPNNIMEICRELWQMQKKLKDQLSKYGKLLETVRINPHHTEASNNMTNLLIEIVDVGKKQNQLMAQCTESISKVIEKYCSEKSLLLDNFRDTLIRQIWSNGVEQCIGDIGTDIYKILFMNQMELIPSNLSKSLDFYDENILSNTIDVANIRLKTGIDGLYSMSNGNSSLKHVTINNENQNDIVTESEPRCTRSSKIPLKRLLPDLDQLKRTKSRKRTISVVKPNSCCTICSKLMFVNQSENIQNLKDNLKMLICCDQCLDKYYSSSYPGSAVISNSNEEESGSPSDSSSQNNI